MLLSYHRFLRTSANYCTLEELQRYASVVEWSITTGCKPVAFGLRRFESSPAHQIPVERGDGRRGLPSYMDGRIYATFSSARVAAGILTPRVRPVFLTSKTNSPPFISTVTLPPESTPRLTINDATLVRILSWISRRSGRAP